MTTRKPVEFAEVRSMSFEPSRAQHGTSQVIKLIGYSKGFKRTIGSRCQVSAPVYRRLGFGTPPGHSVSFTSRSLPTLFMSCIDSGKPPRKPARQILTWPSNVTGN
jgi:hypothetical protein